MEIATSIYLFLMSRYTFYVDTLYIIEFNLSKLMEIATSIYLFLMSGMNVSLELSGYWAFALVHAASKLGCENYSLNFIFIVNKGEETRFLHDRDTLYW